MPEIICLGEILVDMFSTQAGVSLEKAPGFLPVPGGAPANVAIRLAKLGVDSGSYKHGQVVRLVDKSLRCNIIEVIKVKLSFNFID